MLIVGEIFLVPVWYLYQVVGWFSSVSMDLHSAPCPLILMRHNLALEESLAFPRSLQAQLG